MLAHSLSLRGGTASSIPSSSAKSLRTFGLRNLGVKGTAGEQSIVTDAVKPLGQNVEQEAPDELIGRQRHCAKPLSPVAATILVAEGYATL